MKSHLGAQVGVHTNAPVEGMQGHTSTAILACPRSLFSLLLDGEGGLRYSVWLGLD